MIPNIVVETTVSRLPATNDKTDPKAQVTEQPAAQKTASTSVAESYVMAQESTPLPIE